MILHSIKIWIICNNCNFMRTLFLELISSAKFISINTYVSQFVGMEFVAHIIHLSSSSHLSIRPVLLSSRHHHPLDP